MKSVDEDFKRAYKLISGPEGKYGHQKWTDKESTQTRCTKEPNRTLWIEKDNMYMKFYWMSLIAIWKMQKKA